ncbi:MAG: PAS domain S-box protein, partial [Firmicutes bacterium]|nr:PAS domain S-box protein [Bacillota bacterium]
MTDWEYTRFLEFILDHLQEAIYIGDQNGKVLFINKEAERLDGMSRKNVIDKNEVDIYGTENSRLVVKSGVPIVDERTSYRMLNGQMKYVLHSVYPYSNGNKIIGNVSITRDITK